MLIEERLPTGFDETRESRRTGLCRRTVYEYG